MASKRERYIAIVAGVVIGLLLFDYFIYTPITDRTAAIDADLEEVNDELTEASILFSRSAKLNREWAQLAGSNVPRSETEAESRVLNSAREWAQSAGLTLTQLKPDRTEDVENFKVRSFRAVATGQMEQVGRFLYSIEKGEIPIRISDLNIASKKEGQDDLTVTLTVTTIFLPPTAPAKGAGSAEAQS